jgi:hypothetical protein
MESVEIRPELIPLTVSTLFTVLVAIEVVAFEDLTFFACGTSGDDKSKRDLKRLMLNFQAKTTRYR